PRRRDPAQHQRRTTLWWPPARLRLHPRSSPAAARRRGRAPGPGHARGGSRRQRRRALGRLHDPDAARLMPANRPATGTPRRRPGSVRRTSTVTVAREADSLRIDARARGVHTDANGDGTVLDAVRLAAVLDAARQLLALDVDGERVDDLQGVFVGPGFRRLADAAFPDKS